MQVDSLKGRVLKQQRPQEKGVTLHRRILCPVVFCSFLAGNREGYNGNLGAKSSHGWWQMARAGIRLVQLLSNLKGLKAVQESE